jgi:L-rhamnose mutarotase
MVSCQARLCAGGAGRSAAASSEGRAARWQSEMAALIDPLTDPATGFHQRLEEIFHLD